MEKIMDILPIIGQGYLGVFIVIGILILSTALLNKFTKDSE